VAKVIISKKTDQMEKEAKIISINTSFQKGGKKSPIEKAYITALGIEGDAHSGDWHRQVSMLSMESIKILNSKGAKASPGDFGENLTVSGIDMQGIEIGDRLTVIGSSAVLEVTQIGKHCDSPCSIYYEAGYCIMPTEGVFLKVISPGSISKDDMLEIIKR
jgi:MOSC domain-containing protein YiiM